MFDKIRLKSAVAEYKKRFVDKLWPDEKYKWEAVKCFQVNWDINSDDFAGMLSKSLSQTSNLLASVNHFPAKMIKKFAEIADTKIMDCGDPIFLYDDLASMIEHPQFDKMKKKVLGIFSEEIYKSLRNA